MHRELSQRVQGRLARHRRIRKRVRGMPQRPRLSVYRSRRYLYAQVIDDVAGRTLFGCSTRSKTLASLTSRDTSAAAQALGKLVAAEAGKRGIRQLVLDRGGYRYHGRVRALTETLRQTGIQV
jgi:large subunit ribosomal protein L18